MAEAMHFTVDPRLAELLTDEYTSTTEALMELVDNAWDADASEVRIQLPEHNQDGAQVVVEDNGEGMTPERVEEAYLRVARGREQHMGPETADGRKVNGTKGVGKFAGFVLANQMRLETISRGQRTEFKLTRDMLVREDGDLEAVEIAVEVDDVPGEPNGTRVTLTRLNQNRGIPSKQRLRASLYEDYGREPKMSVYVNDERLSVEDVPGETRKRDTELTGVGHTRLRLTVTDKLRNSKSDAGVYVVSGDEVLRDPQFFGLDEDDDIPNKILRRFVGEVEAEEITEEYLVDGDSLFSDEEAIHELKKWVYERLRCAARDHFQNEINLKKARIQQQIDRRLQQLPEYRRKYAKKKIDSVLTKFYSEPDSKQERIIRVVLDAIERDEYYVVVQEVDKASHLSVGKFAEALDEFGMADTAHMAYQARQRLTVLERLQELVEDDSTDEAIVHTALENNLWVFGTGYSVMTSDKTLKTAVEELEQEYEGTKGAKRPDLFLARGPRDNYLLVEFKRPSHTIDRDDEAQAQQYRDELSNYYTRGKMSIIVVGGKVDPSIRNNDRDRQDLRLTSYRELLSEARGELKWLIEKGRG